MDNVPKPAPIEAAYFERPEGSPSVLTPLIALNGVCATLEAEQVHFNDHAQLERIEGLGVAAGVLARDLFTSYGANKPSKPKRKPRLTAVA